MSIIQFYQKYIGSFLRLSDPREIEIADPNQLNPAIDSVNLLHMFNARITHRRNSNVPFASAFSLGRYSNLFTGTKTNLGQLIFLMKYQYVKTAAERLLKFTCQGLKKIKLPYHPDLIVSIPDSLINRPFSPTRLIASGLAEYYYAEYIDDLIQRKRLGPAQKNRLFNDKISDQRLRYSLLDRDSVRGKHILLFDDIFDTGQTALEAGRHLRSAGAKSIMLVTLAYLGSPPPPIHAPFRSS